MSGGLFSCCEEQGTSSEGMEVEDLPGRKCQPNQAVVDLFRYHRVGEAGRKNCPH